MNEAFRRRCAKSRAMLMAVFVLLFVSSVALAQEDDPHRQHRELMQQAPAAAARAELDIPDAELVDRHGRSVRLVHDVFADRIVVVNFVYTTCTTVCPVLSAIFAQVQAELGDRVGDEVVLVSLSVDPLRDTPARMNAYAGKLGAGDGWAWLTGEREDVTGVLTAFGAYTPNFEDHPSMILVGEAGAPNWSRFLGFPAAGQIVARIDELSAGRHAAAGHNGHKESR